ncbi:MAG: lipase family protein [Caulobacteraceae bacterium]
MSVPHGFDKKLALFLANCCLQAYDQFRCRGNFTIPFGYKLVDIIRASPVRTYDLFGFIIESEENIVVAFRGSQSNPDWIADAAIHQSYFPYTRVKLKTDSGFTSIYNTCRNQIANTLSSLSPSKRFVHYGAQHGGCSGGA